MNCIGPVAPASFTVPGGLHPAAWLLKIRSTRTTIGLVLGMIALILLFSLPFRPAHQGPNLTMTTEDQRGVLSVGSLAGVFSALAGIMLVTSEYRYGTIRPTFLFTPKRPRVLAAKLAAGLLAGLVFGIAGEGLALCGAIGVGLGAIIGLLAWGFVAENLLIAFLPAVGRYTLSTPATHSSGSPPTTSCTPRPADSSCSPGRSRSRSPASLSPPAATSTNPQVSSPLRLVSDLVDKPLHRPRPITRLHHGPGNIAAHWRGRERSHASLTNSGS